MAQQTAVDWLFIQLYEKFEMKGDGVEMDKVLEQAKQMEKEQRIAAQMDMFNHMDNAVFGLDYLQRRDEAEKYAEQYYTKTYGK